MHYFVNCTNNIYLHILLSTWLTSSNYLDSHQNITANVNIVSSFGSYFVLYVNVKETMLKKNMRRKDINVIQG